MIEAEVATKIKDDSSAQPKSYPYLDKIEIKMGRRSTYGYRRITAILRGEGHPVNFMRVHQTRRNYGRLLQAAKPRPARTHTRKVIALASDMRWCSNGFGLQCSIGEQLQVAFAPYCCDREAISWTASSRDITEQIFSVLLALSAPARFGAEITSFSRRLQWLTDHGPC